jgi:phenylalanyl-tRNA synthetase beta chain
MKISTTWINEWLGRTMSDRQIADALEVAGIEIEQLLASEPIDDKVIVALVTKVAPHPQADRLHLVEIDTGSERVNIVCGAANVG